MCQDKKSLERLRQLELAREEGCSPGFCGTIWINKLRKEEITEADLPWNEELQINSQESSEKNS